MSLLEKLSPCVISVHNCGQAKTANVQAFKTEKIPLVPPAHVCFSLFQTVFTLWSPAINWDTSCKCFHCNTESFLSGSNMWYQFIILNNATRNLLTLKIKRELCNLTLKSPCFKEKKKKRKKKLKISKMRCSWWLLGPSYTLLFSFWYSAVSG